MNKTDDNVVPIEDLKIDYLGEVKQQVKSAGNLWDNPIDLPSLVDVDPIPREWTIKNILLKNRGAVVSGIGGSSKTRFMVQVAVGIVVGWLPWDWEVVRTGRALLVLTEDTVNEFHYNIHYICKSMGLTDEQKKKVYNKLTVYPIAGQDSILLEKEKKGTVVVSALYRGLEAKIKELGDVVFVGLDPALSFTDGDELDQGHQRRLGKMCDDLAVNTDTTVLMVAHAAKTIKEEITSHNSRGGGALIDKVRAELVMRTMTTKEAQKAININKEERHKYVQLVATKGNAMPVSSYAPVWLERDDYGNLSQADIDFKTTEDGPSKRDLDALALLKEMAKDGVPVPLDDWRKKVIEKKIIKAPKQSSQIQEMKDLSKRLRDAGKIRTEGKGKYLPEVEDEEYDMDFNDA